MPLCLEIVFASLSAISIILSIYTVITAKFKNRISSKTLDLQEVIFGETKYSYDDDGYLKHVQVKLILYNSTEKSFLLSKCSIAQYSLCKQRTVSDNNSIDDDVLGIKIPPTASTEIDGIIHIDYNLDIQTLTPITLTLSNRKQIAYSTVKQVNNKPH